MLVNCRFRSLCRFTNFYTKVWLILEMENSQWELVLRQVISWQSVILLHDVRENYPVTYILLKRILCCRPI